MAASRRRATLHLRRLDTSAPDAVLAQDRGEGRFFALAGDTVAWSYPFGPVSVYSFSRAATATLADEGAYGSVVGGGAVY